MINNFFFENRAVYEIMWRNIVDLGGSYMIIWHMRIACRIPKATHTHTHKLTICKTYCFSTTRLVARTRLSATLYVPCLSCWVLKLEVHKRNSGLSMFNPLNPELNPICYLLTLLGAHHFLHVSRIRVESLTLRLLMSYIYIWRAYSWCF